MVYSVALYMSEYFKHSAQKWITLTILRFIYYGISDQYFYRPISKNNVTTSESH